MTSDDKARKALIKTIEDAIRNVCGPAAPADHLNLRRMAKAAVEAYEANREPDLILDDEYPEPELGFLSWSERESAARDYDRNPRWDGNPLAVEAWAKLPPRFIARVVLTRDDDGEANETEVRWFKTEAEAREAIKTQDKEENQ